MGSRSGAALVVGVLSGVYDEADLHPEADLILPDISHVLPFMQNNPNVPRSI